MQNQSWGSGGYQRSTLPKIFARCLLIPDLEHTSPANQSTGHSRANVLSTKFFMISLKLVVLSRAILVNGRLAQTAYLKTGSFLDVNHIKLLQVGVMN